MSEQFENLEADMSEIASIALHFPIKLADRTMDAVFMRRPKIRDMMEFEKFKGSDAERELALFCKLCELKKEELLELDSMDYMALQEQFVRFRTPPKKSAN